MVSDAIRSAHSTLSVLVEHLAYLDGIAGQRNSAQAQLNATTLELSAASKRLEAVKVELKKAEGDLQGKKHIIHDEAARALADVNRHVLAQQEESKKLDKEIAEKKIEFQNIIDGMKALQARLRV